MSKQLPAHSGLVNEDSLHPLLRGVEAVLFDAGGTIVYPDWQQLRRLAKAEGGRDFTHDQMRTAFCRAVQLVDLKLQANPPALERTRRLNWVFAEMFALLGINQSGCKRLAQVLKTEHQKRHIWCQPAPELLRVLRHLKKIHLRVGVISNTEDGRLEESLRLVNMSLQFEFLIDSQLVGVRKPDARIFCLALDKLYVPPDAAVYVGDSYWHDVLGAQNAGLRAILLDPLEIYQKAECVRIRALTELIEYC